MLKCYTIKFIEFVSYQKVHTTDYPHVEKTMLEETKRQQWSNKHYHIHQKYRLRNTNPNGDELKWYRSGNISYFPSSTRCFTIEHMISKITYNMNHFDIILMWHNVRQIFIKIYLYKTHAVPIKSLISSCWLKKHVVRFHFISCTTTFVI